MNILHWFSCEVAASRKYTVINLLSGYIVFLIVCGPWIFLLSNKYDKLMFTNAGAFNMGLVSPNFDGRLQYTKGFIPPANPSATSFMEDPAGLDMPKWSPFESVDSLKYYVENNFEKNIWTLVGHLKNFSPFVLAIIIITASLSIRPLRSLRLQDRTASYILLTFLVFPAGYIMVVIFERYVWGMCLLLLLMGGYIMDRFSRSSFSSKTGIMALCLAVAGPFIYMQVKAMRDYDIEFDVSAYRTGSLLNSHIPANSRIASDDQFRKSLFITYHLRSGYYGIPRPGAAAKEILADLDKHKIEYYLIWDRSEVDIETYSGFEKITVPGMEKPEIYRIKK